MARRRKKGRRRGLRIGKIRVGKALSGVMRAAAGVASHVPGLGTAVAAGLGAGSALVEGKGLGAMASRAVGQAVPGVARGLVQQATRTAVGALGQIRPRAPRRGAIFRTVGTVLTGGSRVAQVAEKLARKPRLLRLDDATVARYLGVTTRTVAQSRGLLGRIDVGALDEGGRVYVVESGDFPARIAEKLTGSSARYPELFAANPQKPLKTTPYGQNFKTLWPGERLTLPNSWVEADEIPADVIVARAPVPEAAPPVVATPTVSTLSAEQIIEAKALLGGWGKSDGASTAPLTDYPGPADLVPSWTPRDSLQLRAFEASAGRPVDGALQREDIEALWLWAQTKVPIPLPRLPLPEETTPSPSQPSPPIVSLPPVVASPPPPIATPPIAIPAPAIPIPTLPPVVAAPTQPKATPPKAPPEAKPDDTAPLAIGAALAAYALGLV